jgi:hypothetical protein
MDAMGKGHENVWSCCSRKNVPPVDLPIIQWAGCSEEQLCSMPHVSVQTLIGHRQPAGSSSSPEIKHIAYPRDVVPVGRLSWGEIKPPGRAVAARTRS